MKILFTSNIPSPYVIDYLNEISKYCEVTALFELCAASDRVEKWYKREGINFKIQFLNAYRIGNESGISLKAVKYLKMNYDRIVVANPATPTGVIILLYCRMCHINFIIQSEGGFQGSGKGIKEHFKKYIMEKADFYLTGMGTKGDYFLKYGATPERLKWYPFSSMYQKEIDKSIILHTEKEDLKQKLNIKSGFMVLSVGRFIECKGYDILIKAAKKIEDAVFYFIGGKPTKKYKKMIADLNVNNVFFVDFITQNELNDYYHCADVFVLATRGDTWGLVINEAMAKGLPVVTTNRCIAGVQLIENNINGYITDADDVEQIVDKLNIIKNDDALRKSMKKNNIEKISLYSIENMAKIIYSHIK